MLTQKDPTELYDKDERTLLLEGIDEDIKQLLKKDVKQVPMRDTPTFWNFIEDSESVLIDKEPKKLIYKSLWLMKKSHRRE